MFVINNYRNIIFLILFFICLNILYFLNIGLYWDDWWLVALENQDRNLMFQQAGAPWMGPLQTYLIGLPGFIWIYRSLFFILSFIISLCIYNFFKKLFKDDRILSIISTLFFISLPFNEPRILIICFSYTLNLFFFFMGFQLLNNRKTLTIPRRILSLTLFTYAFTVGSLFFLYIFFLFYLVLDELDKSKWAFKNAMHFIKKHLDFYLLPLFFLFLKYAVLPQPHGEYLGYNSLHFRGQIFWDLSLVFIESIKGIFSTYTSLIAMTSSLVVGGLLYCYQENRNTCGWSNQKITRLIFLSAFLFVVAVLPYLLVGRTYESFGFEWRARDEMLLPFAFSLSFTTLLIIINRFLKKLNIFNGNILVLTISIFLILNFSFLTFVNQINFLGDMIKQDALLSFYKHSEEMKKMHTIFFVDKAPEYNIFHRGFGNSELNGMAQQIFKTQDRYFSLINDATDVCPEHLKIGIICKNWTRGPIEGKLSINASAVKLTSTKILKYTFIKNFNREEYYQNISQYFDIRLKRIKKIH